MHTPATATPATVDASWVKQHLERNLNRVLNPAVCFRVLEALAKADSDFTLIAGTLQGDPYISAKVVGLANVQRRPGDPAITDIGRAVAILGTKHVQTLVLAVMLTGPLVSAEGHTPRRRDLWRWVFGCAAAGDFVHGGSLHASSKEAGGANRNMVNGLVLGLGAIILDTGLGAAYQQLLGATLRPIRLAEREKRSLGVTHHEVTLWALEAMRCPAELGRDSRALVQEADEEATLRARAMEIIGARIAGFETERADDWLTAALPKLGIDAPLHDVLPALRTRSRQLTKIFDTEPAEDDTGKRSLKQKAMIMAGRAIEEMLYERAGAAAPPSDPHVPEPTVVRGGTDPSTGLVPRHAWPKAVRELEGAAGERVGALLVGLEGLKALGDRFGLLEVERAAGLAAMVMQSTTREAILLGRHASGELVGLYRVKDTAELKALAAEVHELFAAPEAVVADRHLTASIGGVMTTLGAARDRWTDLFRKLADRLAAARAAGIDRTSVA